MTGYIERQEREVRTAFWLGYLLGVTFTASSIAIILWVVAR